MNDLEKCRLYVLHAALIANQAKLEGYVADNYSNIAKGLQVCYDEKSFQKITKECLEIQKEMQDLYDKNLSQQI